MKCYSSMNLWSESVQMLWGKVFFTCFWMLRWWISLRLRIVILNPPFHVSLNMNTATYIYVLFLVSAHIDCWTTSVCIHFLKLKKNPEIRLTLLLTFVLFFYTHSWYCTLIPICVLWLSSLCIINRSHCNCRAVQRASNLLYSPERNKRRVLENIDKVSKLPRRTLCTET